MYVTEKYEISFLSKLHSTVLSYIEALDVNILPYIQRLFTVQFVGKLSCGTWIVAASGTCSIHDVYNLARLARLVGWHACSNLRAIISLLHIVALFVVICNNTPKGP